MRRALHRFSVHNVADRVKNMKSLNLSALLQFGCAWIAFGQDVVPTPGVANSPTHPPATNSSARASTNSAPSSKAPSPPQSPDDKRLQEILKLQFDRRPAAILKALAKKAEGAAALTNDMQRFEVDVAAGDWKAVNEFLAKLPEKQVPQVYKYLLQSLQKIPPVTQPQPTPDSTQPPPAQSNQPIEPVLLPDDILGLADARPGELQDAELMELGRLL